MMSVPERQDQDDATPIRATIIGGYLAIATPLLPPGTVLHVVDGETREAMERGHRSIGQITLPDHERNPGQALSQLSFFAESVQAIKTVTVAVQSDGRSPPSLWPVDIISADDAILRIVKSGPAEIMSGASIDDLNDFLTRIRRALEAVPTRIGHAIDVATTINGRLYVDGWIENAPMLRPFFMSADCSVLIPPMAALFKTRMDVDTLIKREGRTSATHHHGICAASVIPFEHIGQRIGLYLDTGAGCTVLDTFLIDKPAPDCSVLARLWEVFSEANLPNSEFATFFIAPLIDAPVGTARTFTPVVLHASPVRSRLSIVVPLYGEPFFMRSLLAMQQFMPDDFEWIFVCDDARIASGIADLLRSRTAFMRGRTILVLNHDNYGYAASNNIGVLNATADTLLFMNSDVWIRSPAPLEAAIAALAGNRWTMLGFHLLFEDGTTQHREIEFARNPDYGNLYLAEHPGKGLPSSVDDRDAIRPALAVTGALLMIRKADYNDVGGFNEAFIKGDFEDTDICLRVVSRGGRTGVVPTRECFHLERQSIRTIESNATRSAVTYCNCVTFNDLWADYLDGLSGVWTGGRAVG